VSDGERSAIQRLDDATVRQIAAGEVVERPASAVKELVENAIDADASRVTVSVAGGGKEAITVRDNGRGMAEAEVREAVKEHTTSKLRDIDDLESGVGTLGFRGEALYAIGGVSRLTVRTRKRGTERGTELVLEDGEVTDVSPVGCPEGTTVEVEDLFYNVPARRKYLKQDSTEFAHVNRVVRGYALANPDVAVTLEHDGRETFATNGRGDLGEALLSVYGREVAANVMPVEGSGEGPLEGVSGLVSHPETTRASRDYLTVLVNGRYVTASVVREAVVAAYDTQLAPDRYPFAVLSLSLDPSDVDVNVHPRKMRVRYNKAEEVKRQVRTAVEDALREEGILRSSAPRGRSAPEQATIEPSSTSDWTGDTQPDEPVEAGDRTGDDGDTDTTPEPSADTGASSAGSDGSRSSSAASSRSESTSPPGSASADSPSGTSTGPSGSSRSPESTGSSEPTGSPERSTSSGSAASDPSRSGSPGSTGPMGTDTQTTLHGGDVTLSATYDTLPDLRVLGQAHDTYIVAEADDGLVLVDQHAADERVNYERLKDRFEGNTTTQALADPVEVELTSGEAAAFDARKDALARLGFHADRVDDRTVQVTTVPAVVAEAAGAELIRDVLTDLVVDEQTAEETVEAFADGLLADMACHPSITGNTSLTEGSVVDLLAALDDCENPWACPHGRPVLIHLDGDEIDDRFERDYPGH
jgi:DNA mismatch repair protein MutL